MAIREMVLGFDQQGFDAFLAGAIGVQLAQFSSAVVPMDVVAKQFLTWLKANQDRVEPFVVALLAKFPKHSAAPVLSSLKQRVAHGKTSSGEPPWEAHLMNGVPTINRQPLRAHLERLASGDPRVLMVDGDPGTGRSHSAHLIFHVVCALAHCRHVKIDLSGAVESRTIQAVFEKVTLTFGLNATAPTSEGVTPETLGIKFADRVIAAWTAAPPEDPSWMIFDSLDQQVPPEIRSFIVQLTQQHVDAPLPNCAIFLLGANRNFGVNDPNRNIRLEPLSVFSAHEVEQTALALNSRGLKPLSPDVLKTRIAAMFAHLQESGGPREICSAIKERLLDLRDEVNAA